MAQSLQLSQKMALNQVLAPQLQQSLNLLQAPTLELRTMVNQEMQVNPVLEETPTLETDTGERKEANLEAAAPADPAEPPEDVGFDPERQKDNGEPVDDFQAEINQLLELDQGWRDHFSSTNIPSRRSEEEDQRRQQMIESVAAGPSLQEHLLEQARFVELTEEQMQIAEIIIGNIDDNGFLQSSVDEMVFTSGREADKIEAVLQVIRGFYPPGIGARDLGECLLIQLERSGRADSLEYRLIRDSMEKLGRRRFKELARKHDVSVDAVQDAAERIGYLEPRPGRAFTPEVEFYVVPEIFVKEDNNGEFIISSNNEHIPHLRISNTYKDLMAKGKTSSDVRDYIREKIRSGKFLIKSIHQRQHTIQNIAREIVRRQAEFMKEGVSQLRPMTMAQVAKAVEVHETTVSRAVSGKYIETPHGVFEMKYFFNSGLRSRDGESLANTSIKELLSEMVRNEDPTKPLSDEELVRQIKERGISIARRTVAKYRAELNILPSHLRRVY